MTLVDSRCCRALIAPAALLAALAAASTTRAQMEWNGTQSDSWFNGLNWNPVGPPGGANEVVIDTANPNATVIGLADADAAALTVGDFGNGDLAILNGRTLSTGGSGRIGSEAGSSGQVTITGANSMWDHGFQTLTVGLNGSGFLTVEDGGSLQAGFIGICNQPGSQGTVSVSGDNSGIAHTANIIVGEKGSGSLNISDGGQVSSGSFGFVGSGNQGQGNVTVTGAGSAWQIAGGLRVGSVSGGNGTLLISDQGAVNNTEGIIGNFENTEGTVTVTGAGSAWGNSAQLIVGNEGTGTLDIIDGASVTNSAAARIGNEDGSDGEATVSGTGSVWTSGGMTVARFGTGSLAIDAGGQVLGNIATIGFASPAAGSVTVSGIGSNWSLTGNLQIADQSGIGTLIIENGGTVDTGTFSIIGNSDQTDGTVLVTGAGSHWSVGGDLTVGRHNLAIARLTIDPDASVGAGGAVIVADVVNPGGCDCELRVDGNLSAAVGTNVNPDSLLTGAGSIGGGATTIAGTVAPGSPVGTLSTRDLMFEPTAVLEFELAEPGGTNDGMFTNGDLTLDGTLHVTDLGGFGEGIYTLIEYTGMLTDNTLAIGSLPAGFSAAIDTITAGEVRLVVEALPDDVFSDRFKG